MQHSSFDRPARICVCVSKKSQNGQVHPAANMHPEEDPAFFRKPLPAFPAFGSKKEKKAKAVGFFMQRRIHLSKVSHAFHIVFHAKSPFSA
ncbi:MAG: hypothetical protein KHX34_13825 [Clostridiales bacterium]|nr:hypothetical protein [Clostridiales bacterium]